MPVDDDTVDRWVKELTRTNRERMEEVVNATYNDDYFTSIGSVEDVIRSEFPYRGWRELYFGCLPSNRQVHLIYEKGDPWHRDRDIVVGLLKQVRDELKHARIFTNFAEQFDAPSDMVTWTPPTYENLVEQGRASVEWDEPHHIAAAFQCGTEIMAAFMTANLADFVEPEYPDIASSLEAVVSDEGDHVHVGRLTLKRFAEPDEFDFLESVVQKKYDAAVAALEAKTN